MHHCTGQSQLISWILPPQMLRAIARNGSPKQRECALKTLAIDSTMRTSRVTLQMMAARSHHALMSAAPPLKQRTIYSTHNTETLPGAVSRSEGQEPTADPAVNEAYDGLGDTFDLYLKAYGRNSIDNRGLPLVATVHYGQDYDNAFWNGQQMIFGDGDGEDFNRFTIALDVIGHELTHGVTGYEANLAYVGEPGALNESVSDVFGSLVKQFKLNQTADKADWLIGAGLYTSRVRGLALRSMSAPGTAYDDPVLGKDPQVAKMSAYVHTSQDNGGVHLNSGIPNHAFYLFAIQLGGYAWENAGRVWYETLCDPRLQTTATFARFASLTAVNAGTLFGDSSNEKRAVIDAWNQVEVKTS